MFVGSRTLMRLSKQRALPTLVSRAAYSTTAADDYHSLDDQLFHEMANPVAFQGDKAAIFDAEQSRERRFVPFEIKELTFKCSMGCMGVFVWDYMLQFGIYSELMAAGFVANWMYKTITIMSSTVRKIELHQDGKTVTVTPRIGSPMDVKISQVQKLKHEKDLIQTFEEAYLFPVNIAGKKYYLHGNGQESIKHGEAFRAIINGQSIKL